MCQTTTTTSHKDITSQAAFQAASKEIDEILAQQGVISTAESMKIMQEKMDITTRLETYLPGSIMGDELLTRVKTVLEERGYTPENTLFAQSVCPDEVNHEEGDVTDLFSKYWGEVFHLGGLAGLPFTGKTGFKAFSSHVPDDGHCFVLMAPHIGLDNDGNLGKYSRDFQTAGGSGTCCGAAVGALEYCKACSDDDDDVPTPMDCPEDYQMQFILQQVHKCKDYLLSIPEENARQAALVHELHRASNAMLDKIVNVNFGSHNDNATLVILTGIQINMPRPFDDFFQPLGFYIWHKNDNSREDLLAEIMR